MLPSRRPFSVTAAIVLVTLSAVTTVASWVLHTAFAARVDALLDTPDGQVRLVGVLNVLWVAEPAKTLVVVGGIMVWYAARRRGNGVRVAGALVMTGCVAASLAAAVADGISFVMIFFFAALASAANSLSGGSGLPGGDVLGLGAASIAVDTVLFVLSSTTAILLSMRSWREYCASDRHDPRESHSEIVTQLGP